MSCWLVEKAHIDVLVNALAQFGTVDPTSTAADYRAMGQELWRENNRSVNFRYNERTHHPKYELATAEAPLHPVAVLKAIGCYDYQSCERRDWPRSRANALVTKLHDAIKDKHPELFETVRDTRYMSGQASTEAYHVHPVYDQAPWGFTALEQAFANTYADLEV